jgi:hypothetical protein
MSSARPSRTWVATGLIVLAWHVADPARLHAQPAPPMQPNACTVAGEWIAGAISVTDGTGATFDIAVNGVSGTLHPTGDGVTIHVDAPLEFEGQIHETNVYLPRAVTLPGPVVIRAFTHLTLEELVSPGQLRLAGSWLAVRVPCAEVTAGHWPGRIEIAELPTSADWWELPHGLPVHASARASSPIIGWLGSVDFPSSVRGKFLDPPSSRSGRLTHARFFDLGVELNGFVDARQIARRDAAGVGRLYGSFSAGPPASLAEGVIVRRVRVRAGQPLFASASAGTPWAHTTQEMVINVHGLPGDARWGALEFAVEIPCPAVECWSGATLTRRVQTFTEVDLGGGLEWGGLGATASRQPVETDSRIFRGRHVFAWFDATSFVDEPEAPREAH